MTDIVDRLRALNADFLHEEAADEIQRLRTIIRVNGLRWGVSNAEIDALLYTEKRDD